jgi:ribosomal-protein-alanine N-acetyltransferase
MESSTSGSPPTSLTRHGALVTTARLELVGCSLAAARASLRSPEALERFLGRPVPSTWPPEELRDALALHAAVGRDDPALRGWGLWLALLASPGGSLVGSAGFKGAPDRAGTVEIGYGIEPPFRRRGLATEAAGALLRWAVARGVSRVIAECHPSNDASMGVLRRLGMRRIETRGGMLWWERTAPW